MEGQSEEALQEKKPIFTDLDEDSIAMAIRYFHALVLSNPLSGDGEVN